VTKSEQFQLQNVPKTFTTFWYILSLKLLTYITSLARISIFYWAEKARINSPICAVAGFMEGKAGKGREQKTER